MRADIHTTWTEDLVQQLTTLWSSGMTSRQIAQKMGGSLTRMAVLGKATRLGLPPKRGPQRRSSSDPKREPGQRGPLPERGQKVGRRPQNLIGMAEAVLSLAPLTCKFPIGEGEAPGFHFCGVPRRPGEPYCDHHHRIAYYKPRRIG